MPDSGYSSGKSYFENDGSRIGYQKKALNLLYQIIIRKK